MKVVGVVQMRMGSTRLPGKVLADIEGKPMAWHIVHRLRYALELHDVLIAVADTPENDPVREMAEREGVACFSGSESDLVERILSAGEATGADAIVRITGDCPLVDPGLVDTIVAAYAADPALDYVSNVRPATFPHGLDAELYPMATLRRLTAEIADPLYREWFPVYLWEHEDMFATRNIESPEDLTGFRWTVDYAEDLALVRQIYRRLYPVKPDFGMADILALMRTEPQLCEINVGHSRTEGFLR